MQTATTPGKLHGSDEKTAAAAAAEMTSSDAAAMSDVVVENGRIVLQYRNVNATHAPRLDEHRVPAADALNDRTRPGHVIIATDKPDPLDSYDMNDVVWKNLAASSAK